MDPVVQQIKDRINIVEIVGQYMQLRRAGRSYTGRCPFHKERTPSFHVSAERGTYKCFGCGEGGDVFSFIQKMDGTDFPTVLKQLAEKTGVKLEGRNFKQKDQGEVDKEERLREVCEAAVKYFESQLVVHTDALEYLHTRGVKDETIRTWRIGYAPASWDSLSKHLVGLGYAHPEIVDAGFALRSEKRVGEIFDRFRGRIIFPIFDVAGMPIAVSGRFFEAVPGQKQEGEPAKYVNSPETALFKKSRTLYGLHAARGYIRKLDCILLVEGQFDLVMAHQSGLHFAVALSGTALTDEHLILLGRLSKRLVLALDADQAGIRAGLRSAQMAIAQGFEVKIPTFPQGADPADMARENPELLKAAVRIAKPAVEFFLDALKPQAKDARAYAKVVEQSVLPLIAAAQSRIEQEQSARLVSNRLGVSEAAIMTEVGKVKSISAADAGSPDIHQKSAESTLPALDKKVGMLLYGFTGGRERLEGLLGAERLAEYEEALKAQAEDLRFRFDQEVGEHTSEALVAEDMFGEIQKTLDKERLKMKFL